MIRLEEYYAHSKLLSDGSIDNNKTHWQTLIEHLDNVAKLMEFFIDDANSSYSEIEKLGKDIGYYHDVGKAKEEMIKRLSGENIRVVHSADGANILASKIADTIGKCLCEQVIANHHRQLRNFCSRGEEVVENSTLEFLKSNNIITADEKFLERLNNFYEIPAPIMLDEKLSQKDKMIELFCLIKFLHSCLVDADILDTQNFVNQRNVGSNKNIDWANIKQNMDSFMNSIKSEKGINRVRGEFYSEVINKAELKNGMFYITAPPGIGKTFAVFSFAIRHLIANHQRGIVYVSPRISITSQNAAAIEKIFSKENILEYHSSISLEKEKGSDIEDDEYRRLVASENFDYPLVLTTFNQLFNSFFKNKNSFNRRFHNFLNKTIIIDEAHLVDNRYIKPILIICYILKKYYNCSIIFVSATQQNYLDLKNIPDYIKNDGITELVDNIDYYKNSTNRTAIEYQKFDNFDDLAKYIEAKESFICIMPTRKTCQELFNKINSDNKFHLSTSMCKKHIDDCVEKIRNKNYKCILITTSLVELGMDFDFDEGAVNIKNIQSIIQASGRVNRTGTKGISRFIVFDIPGMISKRNIDMSTEKEIAKETIEKFSGNITSKEAIDFYNRKKIALAGKMFDAYNEELCMAMGNLRYQEVSDNFILIDEPKNSIPIFVSYDDEAENILEKLYVASQLKNKKMQKYMISVYKDSSFDNFFNRGYIKYKKLDEDLNIGIYYIDRNLMDTPDVSLAYRDDVGYVMSEKEEGDYGIFY